MNVRARLSTRRIGGALVYHRLDPGAPSWNETAPNLSLGVEHFERHLRELTRGYHVVPASELLAAAGARRRGGRIPVAVTFDDDYRSHLERAAPALARRGLPAAFFVCGASFAGPHQFWWQRLERALETGAIGVERLRARIPARDQQSVDTRTLSQIGADIEWMELADREQFSAELADLVGPDPPAAGLDSRQVGELADAGFEIGFHTRKHPNLSTLSGSEVREALRDGRDEVERAAGGRPISQFAYPGGKASAEVIAATREAGYATGFLTDARHPAGADTDPLAIKRLDPAWCREPGQLALALARMMVRRPG